jgi:hypothetical protein
MVFAYFPYGNHRVHLMDFLWLFDGCHVMFMGFPIA